MREERGKNERKKKGRAQLFFWFVLFFVRRKKKKTIAKNNINSGTEPFSHLQLQNSSFHLFTIKSNSLPLELLSFSDQIQKQIRNTLSSDSRGGDLGGRVNKGRRKRRRRRREEKEKEKRGKKKKTISI